MLTETSGGRGESNTPFPWKICNGDGAPVHVVAGAGVDQIRFVLSLSGDSARLCEAFTEHSYRPRGIPSMRMVGAVRQDGYKQTFLHFMGDDQPILLYHRDSGALHVDMHFERLAAMTSAVQQANTAVTRLASLGIETMFPIRVARADFTGDVVFRSAAYFRYVMSAFRSMICERGRVVEPYKSSTLYLSASRARRSKRLGRIYDKGLERASVAGWDIPPERYLRIEAESLWEGERPLLTSLDSGVARSFFLDRFAAVGKGTLSLKGGLVEPLMGLLREDTITSAQYEQLYAFLDHSRMGLASDLYPRDTRLRRAKLAHALGLEVPSDDDQRSSDVDQEFDVRALVREIAESL
jgi:hypothetical protein